MGPGLSEAGDSEIDQPRVARREFLVVDAQPLGDARSVFLDDHVGALREPAINFLARPALQIDPDRFLVAGERVVRRAIEAVACCARARGASLLSASSRRS